MRGEIAGLRSFSSSILDFEPVFFFSYSSQKFSTVRCVQVRVKKFRLDAHYFYFFDLYASSSFLYKLLAKIMEHKKNKGCKKIKLYVQQLINFINQK
jgi:hypothetical protein